MNRLNCFLQVNMEETEDTQYHIQSVSEAKHTIINPVIKFSNNKILDYIERIEMSPGVVVYIIDIPADQELTVGFETKRSPLEFSFCLKGDMKYFFESDSSNAVSIETAKCYISKESYSKGTTVKDRGTPLKSIFICMDPTVIKLFLESGKQFIKKEFQQVINESDDKPFMEEMPLTSSMLSSVKSIFDCKYKNPIRKIYLSSKITELMSLVMMDMMVKDISSGKSVLQPGEVDKIIEARNILIDNMQRPPTINVLAKKVCLNNFKLKNGFKEVFGTTVFGYFQQQRMEKARKLLESGRYSVSEIAWEIGYTNVSHFISAFRKVHGENPGKYLSRVKQDISAKMLSNVQKSTDAVSA